MRYGYRCNACRREVESPTRGDTLGPCGNYVRDTERQVGCYGELRRVFQVQFAAVMQEHFNTSTGQPVSDMRQFRDQLKRTGDAQMAQTGIPCDYQPAEGDAASLGVTQEGLHESNAIRRAKGQPILAIPD